MSSGRKVYERLTLQDFQTSRIESIAVGDNGMKVFVGTADGNLKALTFKSNNITGPGKFYDYLVINTYLFVCRHFSFILQKSFF